MGGFMTAASVGVSMYTADQANQRQDQIAADQNRNNTEASNRSIAQANADNAKRKAELLRRFNVSSGKLADSAQDINTGLATTLTSMDMQLVKAQSVTNNILATNHVTGRLAERMRNAGEIQGSMAVGNAVQDTNAQLKDIGSRLETMAMNKESEDLNLDIDTSNAVTAANNQLVSNHAYSQSSGLGGVLASGISTGVSVYSVTK
jgi:hypothetical protein